MKKEKSLSIKPCKHKTTEVSLCQREIKKIRKVQRKIGNKEWKIYFFMLANNCLIRKWKNGDTGRRYQHSRVLGPHKDSSLAEKWAP